MNYSSDVLTLTRRLLSFNTINPPGQEYDCAHFLASILEKEGFQIEYYDLEERRPNIIARLGHDRKRLPLCFSGHLDTVPLGTSPWSRDPFKGEIEGGKLYGRGSTDMKGGIAAMVIASLRLAQMSRGTADIMLILSVGEERGCLGVEHLVQRGIPLGRVGALIVGEPTSNYPLIGHKGALFLEGQTSGVTAHGSMPEHGVNAIYNAARGIIKLAMFDFGWPAHSIYGIPTLNVGTVTGGEMANIVPDKAVFGIDIRTIPGQDNAAVLETIRSLLAPDVTVTCVTSANPVATDANHEWIQQVFDIMKPYHSERPVPRVAPYFTDASALVPALGNPPTILLGPGEPEMAHKTDEFCYISKLEKAAEAYFEIGKNWVKDKGIGTGRGAWEKW